MEQNMIPTAKTMATRSDSLGIDHLKPAYEVIAKYANAKLYSITLKW